MAGADFTITIARPLDDVFRVLTTPELTPRWSANAIEERTTSEGPVGVGSTRSAVVRGFGGGTTTNEAVVTAFEPGRRIALRSTSGPAPFATSIMFSDVAGGTRVDWSWTFDLRGPAALFGPLVAVVFRRAFRPDLDRLKAMMERGEL